MSYIFNNKKEAEDFVKIINEGENIPRFLDSVTTSYCSIDPIYDDDNIENENKIIIGWSVIQDEITSKYIYI
jgi:hypothetical protein